jgi:DNA-binding IclR family transcriptional regulator
MASEEGPRTVQAARTTLEILKLLRDRQSAGVTEVADELGISKATAYNHLATIRDQEFVTKEDGQYRLSLLAVDFGQHVLDNHVVYDVVGEELEKLATETGELAQYATEEHGQAVYLYKAHGENAVSTASSIGMRTHMHCLSLGKAMLAYFPDEKVERIVDRHGLPAKTERTITTRDALSEELERIRDRGYAIDDEEVIPGLKCVAVPLMGNDDAVLGAISISGPASRMEGERFHDELPTKLQRTANVIEINTKFT